MARMGEYFVPYYPFQPYLVHFSYSLLKCIRVLKHSTSSSQVVVSHSAHMYCHMESCFCGLLLVGVVFCDLKQDGIACNAT